MNKIFDVIIIGAGIIGTSIGHRLSLKGWRTLNIDQLSGAGEGSTSNSLAIVRTNYSTIEGAALAWEGYQYWSNWPNYLQTVEKSRLAKFVETGAFVVKTKSNDKLLNQLLISKNLGIPFEEWSLKQLAINFPDWNLSCFSPAIHSNSKYFGIETGLQIDGGVFFPKAGYCNDPRLAAKNLQTATKIAGGEFLFRHSISDIRTHNGKCIGVTLSSSKKIDAPVVVNAAGPYSSKVNNLISGLGATNIHTQAFRHESSHLPLIQNEKTRYDDVITFDDDIASYTRPDHAGSIFVGSLGTTFEHNEPIDVDKFDHNFTDNAWEPAYRLGQRIPNLRIPNQWKGIVDLWDVTEDWTPIYDQTDIPGYYLAIGTSGNQFKSAPVVGLLMAQLIEHCESGHDHDKDPLIFFLEKTKNHICLDFFSRNRKKNTRSSNSVLA